MKTRYRFRRWLDRLLRGRLLIISRLLRRHVTDVVFETRVLYDPHTDIGRHLYFNGQFEAVELSLCRQYIGETAVVLDVGANIGLHSIYFSRLAPRGMVIAFEPSLPTFELLARNVGVKSNITPMNLAISDSGGLPVFFHASDNAYSSLLDTKRKRIVDVMKVPCMKMDDVVDALQLQCVDFVKIDVEGLEHHVLTGMERVIEIHRPVIFCEIYKGIGSNQGPDETVKFMLDRNYRAYVMRDEQLVEYQKHNDRYYNYLFIPIRVTKP